MGLKQMNKKTPIEGFEKAIIKDTNLIADELDYIFERGGSHIIANLLTVLVLPDNLREKNANPASLFMASKKALCMIEDLALLLRSDIH